MASIGFRFPSVYTHHFIRFFRRDMFVFLLLLGHYERERERNGQLRLVVGVRNVRSHQVLIAEILPVGLDRDAYSVPVKSPFFSTNSETASRHPLPPSTSSSRPVLCLDDKRNGTLGSYQKMGREVCRPLLRFFRHMLN